MTLNQELPPWSAGAAGQAMDGRKKRRLAGWPLAFLLVFLACLAGCQYNVVRLAGFIAGSSNAISLDPKTPDTVGVLILEGVINSSLGTTEALAKFRESPSIKAVVIRVDSPGGSVAPCQEIYHEVTRLAKHKPVVISMGSMAASGGLYVAAAGNYIMANEGTVTGSIGVIMHSLNFMGTLEKIGAESIVIKSGPYKDIGSPFKKMTPEEETFLQTTVDILHDQFVTDLAKGRKMPEEAVRAFANGRIFSGVEAKELGLVDQLGGFEAALSWAAQIAEMSPGGRPPVVILDGRGPWWRRLAESRVGVWLNLSADPALGNVAFKYIYQPGL